MIAPSHGQIWTDPMKIIGAYTNWATGVCEDKITIIYDTMHYSTQTMAHEIAEELLVKDMMLKCSSYMKMKEVKSLKVS